MDNGVTQSVKTSTFFSEKKEEINEMGNKLSVLTTSSKFFLYWGYLGIAYYLMVTWIAPTLMKTYFLIGTWDTFLVFYVIVFLIGFLLAQINNVIIKILLYLFK